MKTVSCLLTATVVAVTTSASAGEPPTAQDLLAAYQKTVEKLARVRIEWKETVAERKQPNNTSVGWTNNTTVFRDELRWKIDEFREDFSVGLVGPGKRSETRSRVQWLIGDEIIQVTLRDPSPGNQPPPPMVVAWRDERTAERTWQFLGRSSLIFGRMQGDAGRPIWTVMAEAGSLELLPQTEMVGGVPTHVLKSKGKYGEHQVWLDPASGGLPRRIEVYKHPGNLLNDEQLGTAPAPDADVRERSAPARREYSRRIDKIQIENKEGVFVVTGYEQEFSVTYADGKKRENRNEFKIESLDIDPAMFPENAFRFDIEVPNGTRAALLENFPLEYQGRIESNHEWVDGKIQKREGK